MKTVIKNVVSILIRCIYLLFNYNVIQRFKYFKNVIYSVWIKNSFGQCGTEFFLQSPVYLIGGQYISIGNGFSALQRLRLECWDNYGEDKFTPTLVIGNNVTMNNNVHIGCINMVYIGNNVLFGSNIFISDHQHGFIDQRDLDIVPIKRTLRSNGPVIICDNVWIGENVTILPNVSIGEGCIIGANSVVTKTFPKHSVVAGVPAKIIKTLTTGQ